MRRFVITVALVAALLVAGCGGGEKDSDGRASGPVTLTFWHGQPAIAKRALERLVARFNATHPDIQISDDAGGSLADQMLTKVTAALASGSYPDIAYIFGSDLANVARSDKVLDLTDAVRDPSMRWDTFWPASREATLVDGRVRAIPAVTDNLAMVYNPALFDRAGIPYPTADWSWDDFRRIAKQLTDANSGTFGTGWPGAGGEDTVWRLWPMLWQQGGEILTPEQDEAAFDSPAGVRALSLIRDMASVDKSVYVDPDPGSLHLGQLFANDKMGMIMGGPWFLPDVIAAHRKYGVVPLPGFDGDHTTIAGADNWVVFDNGSARSEAAIEFLTWLTSPEQEVEWAKATQSLPLRSTTAELPEYRSFARRISGTELFAANLESARVRPPVGAYPQISHAVGEAIVAALLGRSNPEDSLRDAAQRANAALSGAAY